MVRYNVILQTMAVFGFENAAVALPQFDVFEVGVVDVEVSFKTRVMTRSERTLITFVPLFVEDDLFGGVLALGVSFQRPSIDGLVWAEIAPVVVRIAVNCMFSMDVAV